jgi:RNA polymerase sigma factor (sigma-70 family)
MTRTDPRTAAFEAHRPRLHAAAYRMLGSVAEADDAVQEAWLNYSKADTSAVQNLGAWLTTVVARVCLNLLRTRRSHPEQQGGLHLPDPIVGVSGEPDPQDEVVVADSVGMAMLVVLETLNPAERVAFVLHDVFGMPFEQIAGIVDKSPAAARQLASRARRRVRASGAPPDLAGDPAQQRAAVDAFLAAARAGDLRALLQVLHPDVVLRADIGARGSGQFRGAEAVAEQALSFASLARYARHVLVNGAPGLVVMRPDGPFAVVAATVRDGRIVELDIVGDPARLRNLNIAASIGEAPGPRSVIPPPPNL